MRPSAAAYRPRIMARLLTRLPDRATLIRTSAGRPTFENRTPIKIAAVLQETFLLASGAHGLADRYSMVRLPAWHKQPPATVRQWSAPMYCEEV